MTIITVSRPRCKKDGICKAECPTKIIEFDPQDGYPRTVPGSEELCLKCGHCVAVCPEAALSLKDFLSPEACPPVQDGLRISHLEAEQFLRARRSIRCFRKEAVGEDVLRRIIEVACFAPSAKNKQPWNWILVLRREDVGKAASLVIEWMRGLISISPQMAEAMGLVRAVTAWERGEDRICRNAPHLVIVHADPSWPFACEDCTIAMTHLDLYAQSLGLGTCWAGYLYTAINNSEALAEWLGLPAGHKAYGAMMVGRPIYTYKRLPLRAAPVIRTL